MTPKAQRARLTPNKPNQPLNISGSRAPRGSVCTPSLLRSTGVLLAGFTLSGCKCEADVEGQATVVRAQDLPLIEPAAPPPDQGSRCALEQKGISVLRAKRPSASAAGSLEVNAGFYLSSGYALLGTRTTATTDVFLATWNGTDLRELDLGRVLGAPEPATGTPYKEALLLAIVDAEAMSRRVRLLKIENPIHDPHIVRGPEFSIPRSDSGTVSIAAHPDHGALIAWDEMDKAALRSHVRGLAFDPETMKERGPSRLLSETDQDAEQPLVLAGPAGFLVAYLRLTLDPRAMAEDALVVEPERALYARRVDSLGEADSATEAVSAPSEHVLTFDAALASDSAIFAYRVSRPGNTLDESAVALARLGWDGTVRRGVAEHRLLGPGAPVLLSSQAETPWLVVRGRDAETLLDDVRDVAEVDLHEEPALVDHIPLARIAEQLLSMKPLGLDWSIEPFDCSRKPH